MSIIDAFIGIFAPYDCLGCGCESKLLCGPCTKQLPGVPERCYHCRRQSSGYQTCSLCAGTSGLEKVYIAAEYTGTAKNLVWQLKFNGAQSAAAVMATQMAPLLPDPQTARIVPVPTATGRARRRGYDQAKLLAKQLSRRSGVPYADYLKRRGQTHQVGASRQRRLQQLNGAFLLKQNIQPADHSIILVDDVITTGATLEAAAKILRIAGYTRVSAAVFAQPNE